MTGGALQFDEFVLVDNEKAGYEAKLVISTSRYGNDGPQIMNSLIVGHAPSLQPGCTTSGIVIPYGHGFAVRNVEFHNFDQSTCNAFSWTRIQGNFTSFAIFNV